MLVTNNPCARRVMRCAEEAAASRRKLDARDVEVMFNAARGADGNLDKGGAEALAYVRDTYKFAEDGDDAWMKCSALFEFDQFVDALHEENVRAARELALKQDDFKEFAKRDRINRDNRKADVTRKRMKKLRATPKQTEEVVTRTGHVNPAAQSLAPDPHLIGLARAEGRKTKE